MIEMKTEASYSNDWRPLKTVFYYDKDPPRVLHFHYRINGIVYTERTEEFIKAFNAEKIWWKMQNPIEKPT